MRAPTQQNKASDWFCDNPSEDEEKDKKRRMKRKRKRKKRKEEEEEDEKDKEEEGEEEEEEKKEEQKEKESTYKAEEAGVSTLSKLNYVPDLSGSSMWTNTYHRSVVPRSPRHSGTCSKQLHL